MRSQLYPTICLVLLCLPSCSVSPSWLPTTTGPLPVQLFEPVDDEEAPEIIQDTPEVEPMSRRSADPDPHHLNFAAGVKVRSGDAALSVAGSWEYRVNEWLGLGALADYAASPFETLLVAPAVWMRPTDRFTFLLAPGWEIESGDGTEQALRLGVSYEIPLGRMELTPLAYWDAVENRTGSFSLGIAIGGRF